MQDDRIKTFDGNSDALKEFQLADLSISEKSKPEFGKQISKKIWGYTVAGFGNYYYNRNVRFLKNRNYANGKIDVQAMFQDRFEMNGKQNYIRLVWQTLQIVNRIVSGLVGRWMQRYEKAVVKAIDDLSQKDKQEQYEQMEFIIENRAKLEQLQQASGLQMLPTDSDLPADKEQLNLWKLQFQRTPEEIETELGCNEVLASNGYYDVMKEKSLHDSAETGFVGTETWMDDQGVIHVDWVKPENAIYSYTQFSDFRDTAWRGQIPSIKISELRRGWGKEFNPKNELALTEEELFTIAQTAKEYQNYTNLTWENTWNTLFLRPYDEWNVRCMKFELKSVDNEPWTVTQTKNNTTYTQKGTPVNSNGNPKKPSENQRVIEDTNWNIYRGVYLPDNDKLIEWGLKTNMIRPQDPKEIGNAEFSYSYYMYQPYEMRNLAIPEKIEAAVDQMILACLKIQQDISLAIPPGWVIDETALQAIDYGLGESANKDIDHAKLLFQTGKLYYRGLDAEGNRVPVPIQEITNTGFFQHVEAFIKTYQFWYQTLRDELGEDPNSISAALQPRVANSNVEASQQMADYATDYIYRAYTECMKITSRKITCLLKDSIKAGSDFYRKVVKQDIGDRQFSTDIRFLPTEPEIARFDAVLQKAMDTTPQLASFIDPNQILRVAKEDVKLAELLFRQGQKKLIQYEQQTAKDNQQATFKAQYESAKQKGEMDLENLKEELRLKGDADKETNKNKLKEIALTGVFQVMSSKEGNVQPEWKPVMQELIHNIMLPLFADNISHTQALGRLIGQNAMQQGMGQQPEEMGEQPEQNQSPQPQQMVA